MQSREKALLTPEGRTPILSGYHIYRAVVDHHMRRFDEIKAFLINQGITV